MDPTIVDTLASVVAKVPLHTIITVILEHPNFATSPSRASIINNADALARLLFDHPETQGSVQRVAFQACTKIMMGEITRMGGRNHGWHFSAQNASAQTIEAFSIADMSHELKEQSPHLWQMLSSMLVSDPTRESQRAQYLLRKEIPKGQSEMMADTNGLKPASSQATQPSQTWDEEDEYWACDADPDIESSKIEGDNGGDARPTKRARRAGTRNSNLLQIVSDKFRMRPCKIPTIFPEISHHCFHPLDELESEMQCPTFNVRSILPLNQRSGTGHRDISTCRALYFSKLDP